MDIIYKIIFRDRLNAMTPPYYYIGSKSNCEIKGGVIFAANGQEYWGSSRYNDYPFSSEGATAEILKDMSGARYDDIIKEEYSIQKHYNVVESPEYFNLSYATVNTFSEPGYSVYRHKNNPNKIIRLKTDDCLIESGEYIHVNTNAVKDKKVISNWVEKVAKKPASDKQKAVASISSKNKIMLKNIKTGESVKVDKSEKMIYDSNIWKNPAAISQKRDTCAYCGVVSTAGNIKRWHADNCKFKQTGEYVDFRQIRTTSRKRIPVVIDGIEYKSINSASIDLGVGKYEIKKLAGI